MTNTYTNTNYNIPVDSPLGDRNGWAYKDMSHPHAPLTYRQRITPRSVDMMEVGAELLSYYKNIGIILLAISMLCLLFGNPAFLISSAITIALSLFVTLPYTYVKVARRYSIYALD